MLKLLVGFILSLLSLLALLFLIGSIGERGKYSESAVLIRTAMECPRLRDGEEMELQAAALVSERDEIDLRFSAFGSELNRSERRRLVGSCDSVLYQLNFEPKDIKLAGPHDPPIRPGRTSCPPNGPFIACFEVGGETYITSRGHLVINTGRFSRYESFGSRQVDVGIQSMRPDTNISLEISLPDASFPTQVIPGPNHMIASARTQLYFESNDKFGPSGPSDAGRAVLETLGVKLQYFFPAKDRLENILLFIVSAVFGIGSTLFVEGVSGFQFGKSAAKSREHMQKPSDRDA